MLTIAAPLQSISASVPYFMKFDNNWGIYRLITSVLRHKYLLVARSTESMAPMHGSQLAGYTRIPKKQSDLDRCTPNECSNSEVMCTARQSVKAQTRISLSDLSLRCAGPANLSRTPVTERSLH